MSRWVCGICGYIYDEEKEGTPFGELPEGWVCPLCGADRSVFAREAAGPAPAPAPAPAVPPLAMTRTVKARRRMRSTCG